MRVFVQVMLGGRYGLKIGESCSIEWLVCSPAITLFMGLWLPCCAVWCFVTSSVGTDMGWVRASRSSYCTGMHNEYGHGDMYRVLLLLVLAALLLRYSPCPCHSRMRKNAASSGQCRLRYCRIRQDRKRSDMARPGETVTKMESSRIKT